MGKPPNIIRLFNTPGHPATDDQVVRALIAFANGSLIFLVESSPDTWVHSGPETHALRGEFGELLNAAVDDIDALAERFIPEVAFPLITTLKVSRTVAYGTRGFRLGYRQLFGDVRTVLGYAIALILDGNLPYLNAVSRCRLQRCGKFYLAKKNPNGGPANRKYCCARHRHEAHDSKQNRGST